MFTLIGLLRLGSLIRYIPHAVTVGFTCGIAVTIFASQIKDLGGLKLPGGRTRTAVAEARHARSGVADHQSGRFSHRRRLGGLIFLLRRLLPNWPGMLIAVVLASLATWMFRLPVETIGSHFGQLPGGLPSPRLPVFSSSSVLAVFPAALSFTLLGSGREPAFRQGGRRHDGT